MKGFLDDTGMGFSYMHNTNVSVMRYIHVHPQYELYVCVDSVRQRSVINGVEYCYRYPCAILSAPFTIHSMSCDDALADTYEKYVFYFGEKLLRGFEGRMVPEAVRSANVGLFFRLTEAQATYLKTYIDTCDVAASTEVENELMLIFIINKLFDFCREEDVVCVGNSSFYMQDVLQYISENFASAADADKIAQRFNVSRSKLDRDFKRFTGVTTHGFVELCRLNHAKFMLIGHSEFTIDDICEQCGFSGTTHFFPFFKKHTGMTPLEFRRKNGKL